MWLTSNYWTGKHVLYLLTECQDIYSLRCCNYCLWSLCNILSLPWNWPFILKQWWRQHTVCKLILPGVGTVLTNQFRQIAHDKRKYPGHWLFFPIVVKANGRWTRWVVKNGVRRFGNSSNEKDFTFNFLIFKNGEIYHSLLLLGVIRL